MTLEQLKNISIIDIDPSTIVDAKDIVIDTNLPVSERIAEYMQQTKNPYFIKIDKIVVKMRFSETGTTINDCLAKCARQS